MDFYKHMAMVMILNLSMTIGLLASEAPNGNWANYVGSTAMSTLGTLGITTGTTANDPDTLQAQQNPQNFQNEGGISITQIMGLFLLIPIFLIGAQIGGLAIGLYYTATESGALSVIASMITLIFTYLLVITVLKIFAWARNRDIR